MPNQVHLIEKESIKTLFTEDRREIFKENPTFGLSLGEKKIGPDTGATTYTVLEYGKEIGTLVYTNEKANMSFTTQYGVKNVINYADKVLNISSNRENIDSYVKKSFSPTEYTTLEVRQIDTARESGHCDQTSKESDIHAVEYLTEVKGNVTLSTREEYDCKGHTVSYSNTRLEKDKDGKILSTGPANEAGEFNGMVTHYLKNCTLERLYKNGATDTRHLPQHVIGLLALAGIASHGKDTPQKTPSYSQQKDRTSR